MRWLTTAALAATVLLAALHWDEVRDAFLAVPPATFGAAVVLHAATLVLRSEAWRLVLAAVAAEPLPRRAVHAANAGAFLAGIAQSHATLPVRLGLLARLRPGAVRAAHIVLADVPILAVEIGCTCLLLAGAALAQGLWWLAAAALASAAAVPLGARLLHLRFVHRPIAGGLTVLADTRLRVVLAALLAAVTLTGAVRVWVLMSATGLPGSLPAAAMVFVSLGVFGLLPLGPSASPAGTVAVLGASGVGSALVLGFAVSATSICAVLVYSVMVAAAFTVRSRR